VLDYFRSRAWRGLPGRQAGCLITEDIGAVCGIARSTVEGGMALSARLPFVLAELPALEGFVDDAADLGVMRRAAVQERSGAVNRIAPLKDRLRRRRRYPDRGLRAFAAAALRGT
jgi:hypothetical protein